MVEVIHEDKPNVPLTELKEALSAKFKWDVKNLVLFGFRTSFGGYRSTGFALVYDNH